MEFYGQATKSKEETIIGQEKEQVEMAYVSAAINKLGENVTATELQDELNNLVGQNKTKVTGSTILKVHFNDTEHEYQVKSGKVTKYEKMDPTEVYAKLYTDGTLILSSYDYTDETREVSEDYRDVSNLTDYEISKTAPYNITGSYPGWMPSALYAGNAKVTSVVIKDRISPKKIDGWFAGMKNCTSINTENLDVSNVSSLDYLFWGCSSLTNLDLKDFNTSNIISMREVFSGAGPISACASLTSLDVSGFDTSNVTDMYWMFGGCTGLTSIDLSNFDTSNVINMGCMFANCSSLTSLDLSNFDTSNVTTMNSMLYYCSSLTTIYVSNKWSNESVTSSTQMFYNCTNLRGAISYDSSKTDVNYANYNTGYFTYKE